MSVQTASEYPTHVDHCDSHDLHDIFDVQPNLTTVQKYEFDLLCQILIVNDYSAKRYFKH